MVAELVTVVGGEQHERLIGHVQSVQRVEHRVDLFVHERDRRHVRGARSQYGGHADITAEHVRRREAVRISREVADGVHGVPAVGRDRWASHVARRGALEVAQRGIVRRVRPVKRGLEEHGRRRRVVQVRAQRSARDRADPRRGVQPLRVRVRRAAVVVPVQIHAELRGAGQERVRAGSVELNHVSYVSNSAAMPSYGGARGPCDGFLPRSSRCRSGTCRPRRCGNRAFQRAWQLGVGIAQRDVAEPEHAVAPRRPSGQNGGARRRAGRVDV